MRNYNSHLVGLFLPMTGIILRLLLFLPNTTVGEACLYVATNGNDNWSGTLPEPASNRSDGPYATLERARTGVRSLRKLGLGTNGITVFVRGGTYYRDKTFYLVAEDSGYSSTVPTVYRPYASEEVTFIGGKPITNWTEFRGRILRADMNSLGISNHFSTFIFDGARQIMARYPNYDWKDPQYSGWSHVDTAGETESSLGQPSSNTFKYKAVESPAEWTDTTTVYVFIYPSFNWFNDTLKVATIDRANRSVRLQKNATFAIRPGDRYFFYGAAEELDSPGEWYLDSTNRFLYFYPPYSIKSGLACAPTLDTLFSLTEGASNLSIQGFTIQCCQGSAVVLSATTSNNLVAGNTIRCVGTDISPSAPGVLVYGLNNRVIGNDIHDIGGSGVQIAGGNIMKLVAANNVVENNHICNACLFYNQGAGIWITGVGNSARNNLIHNCPRAGIVFRGANLLIEYNHVYNVALATDDVGIIYTTGTDWISSRGSVLRFNYLHASKGWGFSNGKREIPSTCRGIYLDDNTGGVDVIGNTIADCSGEALYLHSARDTIVSNNLFLNCGRQQVLYLGYQAADPRWQAFLPSMVSNYEAVCTEANWRAMRGMCLHPTNAALPGGLIMSSNIFLRNVVCYAKTNSSAYRMIYVPMEQNKWCSNIVYAAGGPVTILTTNSTLSFEEWQRLGNDAYSLIMDPIISKYGDSVVIDKSSPVVGLGFAPLPLERAGPYSNVLRASWPLVEPRQTVPLIPPEKLHSVTQ